MDVYLDEFSVCELWAILTQHMIAKMKKLIPALMLLSICILIEGCTNSDTLSTGFSEDNASSESASSQEESSIEAQDETTSADNYLFALEDSGMSTLSVASRNVFAVDTDCKLWGWGQSKYNVFLNKSEEELFPVEVFDSVKSVSSGGSFVIMIRTDDTLWGWGSNEDGQLGLGRNNEVENAPVKIMDDVSAVSTGGGFSVVLKKDNSLWVSGFNYYGVLGNGTQSYYEYYNAGDGNQYKPIGQDSNEFVKVMDNIRSVHANSGTIAAVDRNNCLWAWGDNQIGTLPGDSGQITDDPEQSIVDTPLKLMEGVFSARVGTGCLYILKVDGELIRWESTKSRKQIMSNVKYIDACNWTLAVITEDNSLLCKGLPYTEKDSKGFYKLAENAAHVAVGHQFVSFVDKENDLYCAGLNFYGLVGNGENTLDPTLIAPPGGDYLKTEDDFVYSPVHVLSDIAY